MVDLSILCVILSVYSSNAAFPFRRYYLKDITNLEPNLRASSEAKLTPDVKYVNVKSDNESETKTEGYGKKWVYLLHTDEGQAEWLDLTKANDYEPLDLLANRSLDFMSLQLITRRNKDAPENLTVDPYFDKPIVRSNFFDRKKRTKVLAHGWSPETIGIAEFKNLTSIYLELGDFNIIYVEWSAVSSEEFMLAVIIFPYVARRVSVLLKAIIETYKYKQDMHLIGHGIGAHILGYAAELSEKTLARITGLDPERPMFEKPKSKVHMLNKNDAKFVDIIHSCKGVRGYKHSHGHLDFYPNLGDTPQPGCTGYKVLQETCSHFRALYYYMESLKTEKHFYAYKCKDFDSGKCDKKHTLMGEFVHTNIRGAYYLRTNQSEPFAAGKHVNPNEEESIQPKISDKNPPDACDDDEDYDEDGDTPGNDTTVAAAAADVTAAADASAAADATTTTTTTTEKEKEEPEARAINDDTSEAWSYEVDGDEGVDMGEGFTPPTTANIRKKGEVAKVSEITSVKVTTIKITTYAKIT